MLRINKHQIRFFLRARGAKVIYANSMPRSGSTAIFNALRLMLGQNPDCDLQSAWVREARNLPRAGVYLIKVHGMNTIDAWRASKIIYSYRDPRVALVSMMRMSGVQPSIEQLRAWMRDFAFAERHADLLLRYETMRQDMVAAIHAIGDVIGQNVDGEHIAAQLDNLASGAKGYRIPDDRTPDKVTLMFSNHVTGTEDGDWRTELPASMNARIVDEFGPWLVRHGYPLV